MNAPDHLADLRVNPDWAKLPLFDRKGWRTMKFGDFADSINERVEPADAADEPYVGLDDLDSGDLHIRRWGKGSDVIGTKLRFRKGDIIFGRRRAYQRKLAVAEFDGICSAHAMVVRAKPAVVLPEFLPLLMMSDRFMKRAVEISVGSLSPTINWTTLKLEEFDLPPLEQQRCLASVVEGFDASLQRHLDLQASIASVLEAETKEHFDSSSLSSAFVPLAEVADVAYGITLGRHRDALSLEAPYLRVANVQRHTLDLSEVKKVKCSTSELERFQLYGGDVLLVEGHADVRQIGRAAIWRRSDKGWLHQNHLIRARCHSELTPEYLCLFANGVTGQAYFRERAKSTSGLNTINSTVVKEFRVPVPPLDTQERLLQQVESLREAENAATTSSASIRQSVAEVLNAILS